MLDKRNEDCPPLGDLTAFVDNVLEKNEHDVLLKHITQCERCSTIVAETLELLADDESSTQNVIPLKSTPKKWRYYLSLAAAASVAGFIFFQLFQEVSGPSISSTQMVQHLLQQDRADALIGFIGNAEERHYGFAQSTTSDFPQIAFRSGGAWIDWKVAIQANEKEMALQFLQKIKTLLPQEASTKPLVSDLMAIENQFQTDVQLSEVAFPFKQLSAFFETKQSQFYFQLGAWGESGRLASKIKNTDFFNEETVIYFLENMPSPHPPLRKILLQIQEAQQAPITQRAYFRKLESLFEKLQAWP